MGDAVKYISASLSSVFDDSPIAWSYEDESDDYAETTDGRWIDRESERYGKWMVVCRV
jgi:hypothetical protein